jgi:hypothetical protein
MKPAQLRDPKCNPHLVTDPIHLDLETSMGYLETAISDNNPQKGLEGITSAPSHLLKGIRSI